MADVIFDRSDIKPFGARRSSKRFADALKFNWVTYLCALLFVLVNISQIVSVA